MVQSAAQVFSGITPEQYASLQQKAQANGISLSGNSGKATKFGVVHGTCYTQKELLQHPDKWNFPPFSGFAGVHE